ncbi:hypothetical protein CVT24_001482, partial [Panaeolus cyanescens]
MDRSIVAYYHALVGDKRKRELEEKLASGEIRILFCTDAVGMGCDMRNIQRVVLWGLPPTFCSLVQRAGRAARDLTQQGEAILIVSSHTFSHSVVVDSTSTVTVDDEEPEASGVVIAEATGAMVDAEGARVSTADDDESENEATNTVQQAHSKKTKKWSKPATHIREIVALSDYMTAKACRRNSWDSFFSNSKKLPLIYPKTTSYKPIPNMRCCDNCEPARFAVETIKTYAPLGLKTGKKKAVPEGEKARICQYLEEWRDGELYLGYYPDGDGALSAATLMPDNVIQKLAGCGERPRTYGELRRHIRWGLIHDTKTDEANDLGKKFLQALNTLYDSMDLRDQQIEAMEMYVAQVEEIYKAEKRLEQARADYRA